VIDDTISTSNLKEIVKSAIMELIAQNPTEVKNLVSEVVEDLAIERAIIQGISTESVSREDIFRILES
jgi:hypothetical protein